MIIKDIVFVIFCFYLVYLNGVFFFQDNSKFLNFEKKLDYVVNGGCKEKICLLVGGIGVVKENVEEEIFFVVIVKSCQKVL